MGFLFASGPVCGSEKGEWRAILGPKGIRMCGELSTPSRLAETACLAGSQNIEPFSENLRECMPATESVDRTVLRVRSYGVPTPSTSEQFVDPFSLGLMAFYISIGLLISQPYGCRPGTLALELNGMGNALGVPPLILSFC